MILQIKLVHKEKMHMGFFYAFTLNLSRKLKKKTIKM